MDFTVEELNELKTCLGDMIFIIALRVQWAIPIRRS